jgi:hypothetical protein
MKYIRIVLALAKTDGDLMMSIMGRSLFTIILGEPLPNTVFGASFNKISKTWRKL